MSSRNRWRTSYKENGVFGLKDTCKENSGRKLERELIFRRDIKSS